MKLYKMQSIHILEITIHVKIDDSNRQFVFNI